MCIHNILFEFKAIGAGVLLTGIPRSMGSTGCLKGSDSGSCLYRDSRVGISACRNSSGLKTIIRNTMKAHVMLHCEMSGE